MSEQPHLAEQPQRPIGPLEEGDQALVDVMQRVPEGTTVASHAGDSIMIRKGSGSEGSMVIVDRTGGDATDQAVARVSTESTPSGGLIHKVDAVTGEYPAEQGQPAKKVKYVVDDKMSTGKRTVRVESHRAQAQRLKLGVAQKIGEAVSHID